MRRAQPGRAQRGRVPEQPQRAQGKGACEDPVNTLKIRTVSRCPWLFRDYGELKLTACSSSNFLQKKNQKGPPGHCTLSPRGSALLAAEGLSWKEVSWSAGEGHTSSVARNGTHPAVPSCQKTLGIKSLLFTNQSASSLCRLLQRWPCQPFTGVSTAAHCSCLIHDPCHILPGKPEVSDPAPLNTI